MVDKSEKDETTTPETPPSSDPQSEETEIQFEEPDFSELTRFVEEDGEEPVEKQAEKEEKPPAQEDAVSEEELAAAEEDKSAEGEETAPVEEAIQEEPPKKEAEPEAAQQPEIKIPTKEELQGMYEEHRKSMLPELEKQFQLSDEEAAALDEQPSKVLPQMAARMSYDVMMSTYNAVMAAAPSIVNRLITASQQAQSAEQQFYSEWPDLAKPEAKGAVTAAIQAYRSANPRANLQDVIKKAGVMAMIQMGLDPLKKAQGVQPEPKPVPKPVKPAGAGKTTQMAPPKRSSDDEGNMFSSLAEAFREELS